ncbi:MAG: glycoside hydrolase [Clostridiales bacterium]|nr:glycoside hydrolase [Clostridiales bacterium]
MSMKKIIAGVLSSAIVLTSASFANVLSAENTVILNNTFETSTDGWSSWGSSSVSVSTGNAKTGSGCLKIAGRSESWNGAGKTMLGTFTSGATYEINAWAMYEVGADEEEIKLQLKYKDTQGTDNYVNIATANAIKGEWAEISNKSYTVPADAVEYTMYFETTDSLIDFYVDDIIIIGEDSSGTIIIGEGEFNDDFETGKMGWSGRSSETVEITTDEKHSGSQSLFISNRTENWNGATANKSTVLNAGEAYTFGAWVMFKGDSYSNTQEFSINLYYIQNGSDKYVEVAKATATKGNWAYIEGNAAIPADALGVNVYIQTAYTPNPSSQDLMDFYLDDVSAKPLLQDIETDIASLKDVYQDYFKIGTAAMGSEIAYKSTQDLIKKHFNSLTFGNELKPDSVLDKSASISYMNSTGNQTNPQVSLAHAKSLLDFADANNLPVRGHTLVWHSQTPDWFFKENYDDNGAWVSKQTMIARMENYIKNVMETLATEYPNVDFYAWDVVNEAFSESGTMREPGSNNVSQGQSAWVKVFGDDSFIDYAFAFAREYAPEGCKLYYNDYNEYVPSKRDGIYNKCLELKEKGIIDGIGMQAHLDMDYPSVSLFKEALEKYVLTGLEIQITELDITQNNLSESGFKAQADQYKGIMDAIKDVKNKGGNITAVVFWGTVDSTSWRSDRAPLLFDGDFKAKPAYYSIIEGMDIPVIEFQVGDVNKDGSVNISDLIDLNRYILNVDKTVDAKMADVNADKKVNAFDCIKLKRILLNLN